MKYTLILALLGLFASINAMDGVDQAKQNLVIHNTTDHKVKITYGLVDGKVIEPIIA